MQNSHHTHQAADITGIGSQLDDRMGGGFDEQAIDFFLMQARKSPKLMRQRKDHMIIRYRQEFLMPPVEPCLDVALVAFRATAVATGVIRILLPAAAITLKYTAPHDGCTASECVLERSSMTGRHSFAEIMQILGGVRMPQCVAGYVLAYMTLPEGCLEVALHGVLCDGRGAVLGGK